MPHYYVVPLVESSITVWHPRQQRLIQLQQPLGVDQSEAQTLILGHSGLALVATVDPLHDARATKFAEHRDELVSGAARTALAQIAGDREVAAGRRCGDAIADLLKTPPAAWNMRPLRPSRARTLLTPGYYVWLDPTERTPVYFESVVPRAHSKGWRDHFDAPDGPLNGRTLPDGSGGASWFAGSMIAIVSNQARITLNANTGDSADILAGALPALTDSDDAYVSADLVSVVAGGSNALILYGLDPPDVFVGGLEAGWWGHAGNVFGMWSYATSAAVATSGSTTFTAGTYRIWRSGSSVGLQLWTGSAWVDVLGPVTNTADQGDSCFAGFAAFAHAGSGVFTLDNFTLADDDYSFDGTVYEITPAGVIAPTGVIARTPQKELAGGIELTSALTRASQRVMRGAIEPSSIFIKAASKRVVGAVTLSASLATVRLYAKFLEAAIALTGSLEASRAYRRLLSSTVEPTSTLTRAADKYVEGVMAPSGGTQSQITKSLEGATAPLGALAKENAVRVAGSTTPTSTLSQLKVLVRTFSGSVVLDGSLTRSTRLALTGALTLGASLNRSIRRTLQSSVSFAGSIRKAAQRALNGSIAPSGALQNEKGVFLTLVGSIALSGTLARSALKSAQGVVTAQGALTRSVGKTLSRALTLNGSVGKAISRAFSGALGLASTLLQKIGLVNPPTSVDLPAEYMTHVSLSGEYHPTVTIAGEHMTQVSIDGEYHVEE